MGASSSLQLLPSGDFALSVEYTSELCKAAKGKVGAAVRNADDMALLSDLRKPYVPVFNAKIVSLIPKFPSLSG